jgi:NADP-dependent 3-hydroxy acid dehydrogenase YdfG
MNLGIFGERSAIFAGKKAIVSGGTTGIGRATAIQLARWGADVLLFGRHEPELQDAMEHLRRLETKVVGLCADQADPADVAKVFRRADSDLGSSIDFLINNAAEGLDSLEELSDERIDYAIKQNLTGYLTCTRNALKRMKAGAHIVNVGSISADERGPESEVYTATKAGIRGFSESLRKTLQSRKIRVSLIEPGWVGTDMSDETPEEQRELEQKDEMLKAEDVAQTIAFCLAQPLRCDVSLVQVVPLADE